MRPHPARRRENARPGTFPWKGLLAGACGGVAGALAVSVSTALIEKARRPGADLRGQVREHLRQGGQTRREARGRWAPTVEAARRLLPRARALRDPSPTSAMRAGETMHLAFGTVTGAVYGAAAEYEPRVTAGAGMPYGLAVWIGADEAALPLLGLSKAPGRIPADVHATSLVAHLVFGLTVEAVRRAVRGSLGGRDREATGGWSARRRRLARAR